MSMRGSPRRRPSPSARTPFSTLGMKLRGMAPPTTFVDELEAAARGQGSTSMSRTAYWPWPPDCLTRRPWPLPGPENVSRSDTRKAGRRSTATPYLLRSRSSRTSTCASPMHHSTSWLVSGCARDAWSGPRRRDGRGPASLSSSALVGDDRDRQQRVGMIHGSTSSGLSFSDRVSPVSARDSFARRRCRRRWPSRRCAASCPAARTERRRARRRRGPDPRSGAKWPETWTVWSGPARCR